MKGLTKAAVIKPLQSCLPISLFAQAELLHESFRTWVTAAEIAVKDSRILGVTLTENVLAEAVGSLFVEDAVIGAGITELLEELECIGLKHLSPLV